MNTQYSDLGRNMRRVLQLLNTGGHYSAADISIHLHVCDPRSIIRSLRKKGIGIADYFGASPWTHICQNHNRQDIQILHLISFRRSETF